MGFLGRAEPDSQAQLPGAYGLAYMKQSEDAYAEQVRGRLEKQFRWRANELGYTLTKIDPPATPTSPDRPTAV